MSSIKLSSTCTLILLALLVTFGLSGCEALMLNDPVEQYHIGINLQDEGKYDQAISKFSQAIEIDSDYTDAYVSRGYCYILTKQYDLAIKDYTKAIELDNTYAIAYNGRGAAYLYSEQYEQAVSDFTMALQYDPGFTQAATNLEYASKMQTSAVPSSGGWIDTNPTPGNWGFIMNDQGDPTFLSGSTWYYDCFLDIKENADGTFTATMDRTLRQITGPVTSIPEIMQQVGNSQTCTVTGKHDGTTVDLLFGELTLHLTLEDDHLYGDTYFYDTGSPVNDFKGLTDIRPSSGEYITWVYYIDLKRR